MMIEPVRFSFNPQAAESNSFMQSDLGLSNDERANIASQAASEFANLVNVLQAAGINVLTFKDTIEPHTPDAIFPNNWISMHQDGTIALYPMEAPNRRLERRHDIVEYLLDNERFTFVSDFTNYEHEGLYLEGTGSIVLDRANAIAYANVSSRMHPQALQDWASSLGFTPVLFASHRANGSSIYHTNVMMAVGEQTAVVCAVSITDAMERATVLDSLKAHQKVVVEISFEQLEHFAGNMLQVKNEAGSRFWVMSSQAYKVLTDIQRQALCHDATILHAPLNVIERYGGGSARCMMAEVFSPNFEIQD